MRPSKVTAQSRTLATEFCTAGASMETQSRAGTVVCIAKLADVPPTSTVANSMHWPSHWTVPPDRPVGPPSRSGFTSGSTGATRSRTSGVGAKPSGPSWGGNQGPPSSSSSSGTPGMSSSSVSPLPASESASSADGPTSSASAVVVVASSVVVVASSTASTSETDGSSSAAALASPREPNGTATATQPAMKRMRASTASKTRRWRSVRVGVGCMSLLLSAGARWPDALGMRHPSARSQFRAAFCDRCALWRVLVS